MNNHDPPADMLFWKNSRILVRWHQGVQPNNRERGVHVVVTIMALTLVHASGLQLQCRPGQLRLTLSKQRCYDRRRAASGCLVVIPIFRST